MRKQTIPIVLVVMLLVVGLSGCNEKSLSVEEKNFLGSWIDNSGQVYHFKEKLIEITTGGFTIKGDWNVENEVLYVDIELDDQTGISYKYTYSFEQNQIILIPYGGVGVTVTLTKL